MAKEERESLWITRLDVENWRNFRKASAQLQQRAFLVGPNASGKSNFLDIFRFARDLAAVGGGLQDATRRRGGVSRLRCLSARAHSDISIQMDLGTAIEPALWRYEVSFNQDSQRHPIIRHERVWSRSEQVLDRPDSDDKKDEQRLTQTFLEQVNANRDFRDIAQHFSSIRYRHIVPQIVRDPERSRGRSDDEYGGAFLEQIAKTQERTRNAWLRQITSALRIAVPQLQELELWRDDRGTPHLRGKYEHWRPQGAWQLEEDFSDGTLRLIALLWSLLERGGTLLLEEPEVSLHPEVVRHLPRVFQAISARSGRQIITSTHSPDLLRDDGIGLDEILLLKPSVEGTTVTPASKHRDIAKLLGGGMNLADVILPFTRPDQANQLVLFGSGE